MSASLLRGIKTVSGQQRLQWQFFCNDYLTGTWLSGLSPVFYLKILLSKKEG
jgi:hypothetical protein